MIYLLKVIALGHSRAIVFPAPLLSALDIDCGDLVAIQSDASGSFGIRRAPAGILGGEIRAASAKISGAGLRDPSGTQGATVLKLNATLKCLKTRRLARQKSRHLASAPFLPPAYQEPATLPAAQPGASRRSQAQAGANKPEGQG
jgi:hypothetical protein